MTRSVSSRLFPGNDYFHRFLKKSGGPRNPVQLRGGQTSGVVAVDHKPLKHRDSVKILSSFTDETADYAAEFKSRERAIMEQMARAAISEEDDADFAQSMNTLTSLGETTEPEEGPATSDHIYDKYRFQREIEPQLSINDMKDQILKSIQAQVITIIEGPTGCGKTTQVPQWILDDCWEKRQHCNIIVTQPRRIAAISIAKRVAQERGWELGTVVGYQVGLENTTSDETRLHYVTTGILLQRLVAAQNLKAYTHIVLDEIHERGQEMDFLLLVVRKLLQHSRGIKLILMSATFNIEQFSDYFARPTLTGEWSQAPVVKIDKKPMFEVKTFYLDDLNKFDHLPQTNREEPGITKEGFNIVVKLLNAFEYLDKIENDIDEDGNRPSVLVFLPGINEIEELFNTLHDKKKRIEAIGLEEVAEYRWSVMPLHSTITAGEQAQVFTKPPPGFRKVILSTNIAESSITVPDIKYVIDFCLMKMLVADPQTNFTSLQLSWATHTNLKQREGRAGRVRSGRIYRLIYKDHFNKLQKECPPEMERCPLERLVLLAKMLNMGPPKEILALAMNPPNLSNIQSTILILKEVGGLLKTCKGQYATDDGDLTYMGRIMAKMPVDIRITKMIILGHIFGVLNEAIIMGAGMSVKNIFSNPFQEKLNAYNSKLTWADGSMSDCIAFLHAYSVWHRLSRKNNQMTKGFYLQTRALKELDELVRELTRRLSREGINASSERTRSVWTTAKRPLVLKLVIAGGFYPFYFSVHGRHESEARDAARELDSHDPTDTVYLKNFPPNQPPEVYVRSIKKAVRNLIDDDVDVYFDKNSTKVFLSFANSVMRSGKQGNEGQSPVIPGKVVLPVYKAIKIRQLKMPIIIPILPPEQANEIAEQLKQKVCRDMYAPILPDINQSVIEVIISNKIDCGNFWVQYSDSSFVEMLELIQMELSRPLVAYTGPLDPGLVVAAPFADSYYRARVHSLNTQKKGWVIVQYIDWGNFNTVPATSLRALPQGVASNSPAGAVRARLANVAPAMLSHARGTWSPEAEAFFDRFTAKKILFAKVYSVAHGKISVELFANSGTFNLNDELIKRHFAQPAEESFESKVNHDLRQNVNELNNAQQRGFNIQQLQLAQLPSADIEAFDSRAAVTNVVLKGPHSPLEVSVHNLLYGGLQKQVNVEWSSVNSVLLDTNPDEPFDRLMVAANVGQNQSGSSLTLRHTTVLPAIPGLACIVPLIFCPTMEIRTNREKTRFVQILSGLGHNEGIPLFPEHDMLINVDINLTMEDINHINHVRYLLDLMLSVPEGQETPALNEEAAIKVPEKLHDLIFKVLGTKRRHYAPSGSDEGWEWGAEGVNAVEADGPSFGDLALFPLHALPVINPLSLAEKQRLLKLNDDLHTFVNRTIPINAISDVVCPICDPKPMTLQMLRIHLNSIAHLDNVADLLGDN